MTKKRIPALVLFAALIFAAAAAQEVIKIKVSAELANVRVKPSIGSVIVRQFPQGHVLDAARKEGEWYFVTFEADETGVASGYVHESLVIPVEGARRPVEPKTEVLRPAQPKPEIARPAQAEPVRREPVRTEPAAQIPETYAAGGTGPDRIFLSVFGAWSYSGVGDLNTGAQGLADLYTDQVGVPPDALFTGAHYGLLFGGEVGFPLTPGFFLTFGAEQISAGKESVLGFDRGLGLIDTFTAEPRFSALPLRLGLMYYPMEPIYIKFGAVFTFARAKYLYRFEHDDLLQEWTGDATGRGFGLWGGLGLDLNISETLAFTAEVSGIYAPITGLMGTGTFQNALMKEPVTEEGKLYIYDAVTSSQTSYPLLYIRSSVPAEGGVENAREAKLDLSGFSVRAGLKIRF